MQGRSPLPLVLTAVLFASAFSSLRADEYSFNISGGWNWWWMSGGPLFEAGFYYGDSENKIGVDTGFLPIMTNPLVYMIPLSLDWFFPVSRYIYARGGLCMSFLYEYDNNPSYLLYQPYLLAGFDIGFGCIIPLADKLNLDIGTTLYWPVVTVFGPAEFPANGPWSILDTMVYMQLNITAGIDFYL